MDKGAARSRNAWSSPAALSEAGGVIASEASNGSEDSVCLPARRAEDIRRSDRERAGAFYITLTPNLPVALTVTPDRSDRAEAFEIEDISALPKTTLIAIRDERAGAFEAEVTQIYDYSSKVTPPNEERQQNQ